MSKKGNVVVVVIVVVVVVAILRYLGLCREAIVSQQYQNQVRFERYGSGVVLNFLLIVLTGWQCILFIIDHFLSFKKSGEDFNTMPEPFLWKLT